MNRNAYKFGQDDSESQKWLITKNVFYTLCPHFKNQPEIGDHPGTFGILFSTYYALGVTYCNLTYYLGWIV